MWRCFACSAVAAWAIWANRCRLAAAILPATSHTAVIGQADTLAGSSNAFLKGETPKGMFQ